VQNLVPPLPGVVGVALLSIVDNCARENTGRHTRKYATDLL